MMLVLHEQIFVGAIDGKRYGGCTQARKSSFEPIVPRERPCVPPMFTVEAKDQHKHGNEVCNAAYYLAHGSLAG